MQSPLVDEVPSVASAHATSALRFLFQRHNAEAAAVCGVFDQRGQSPGAGLFLLGAGDPVDRNAPVTGRLRVEELPRLLVRTKLLFIDGTQGPRLVLVRVDRGLLGAALLERAQTGGLHPAEFRQLRN